MYGNGPGFDQDSREKHGGLKMSAFIVGDKTINQILTYIENKDSHYMKIKLLGELGYNFEDRETIQQLGNDLMNMNVSAVEHRYNDQMMDIEPITIKAEYTNKIQVYKSIQCFLYQCTEGKIMELGLFKAMESIKDMIGSEIIRDLPQYETGIWGD